MGNYFENGFSFPVDKIERKKLIGKRIRYARKGYIDPYRDYFLPQYLTIVGYRYGHIITDEDEYIPMKSILEYEIIS